MSLEVKVEPVPLTADADGVLCVEGTRVTLETVVAAFDQGATAEEIVYQYPTLRLADVYAVVSYVLNHSKEVGAYLREREAQSRQVRQRNRQRFVQEGIRQRLLARQAAERELRNAAACG